MSTVEINGKKYNPEDIDCNGKPYEDAVEVFIGKKPDHWPYLPKIGDPIIFTYRGDVKIKDIVSGVLAETCVIKTEKDVKRDRVPWCFSKGHWDDGFTFEKYTG